MRLELREVTVAGGVHETHPLRGVSTPNSLRTVVIWAHLSLELPPWPLPELRAVVRFSGADIAYDEPTGARPSLPLRRQCISTRSMQWSTGVVLQVDSGRFSSVATHSHAHGPMHTRSLPGRTRSCHQYTGRSASSAASGSAASLWGSLLRARSTAPG